MYVLVPHHATDPEAFQATVQNATTPERLKLHQVLPGEDGIRSVCLWEGSSEEAVRAFIEDALGACSINTYLAIDSEHALGLPVAAA